VTLDERKFYILGVHVLPADEVDLRAVTYWRTGYLVSWLYPIRVEPETILRVSVDGGDWFQCTTKYYSNEYVNYFNVKQNSFTEMIIKYKALSDGHTYEFQLRYEGDRFSNILEIDLVNNSLPHVKGGGGDRNGYDRDPEGQMPPEGGGNGGQGNDGSNGDNQGGNNDNGGSTGTGGESDGDSTGNGDGGEQGGNEDPPDGNSDPGGGGAGNNTGGGSSSSGGDRTGSGSQDPDIVTQISTVAVEGPSPVAPLDVAASLPSDSPQESYRFGLNAPAPDRTDGALSSIRDDNQIVRPVATQDIVPDELPAHADEPQIPAPLPPALPLSLSGVAGLSCAGLVLLKKWWLVK